MSEEYSEIPWSIEDTIENIKEIKALIQIRVKKQNLDGKGEQDVEECAFDFDRAISALEKQIPKRPTYEGDGYSNGQLVYDTWICPNCEKHYEVEYEEYDYCPNCGQRLDWSDEE